MTISTQMFDEINLLLQFPSDSMMSGIKIHHDAAPETIEAAKRLFDKGLISADDGGYLTDAGIELVEHAQILNSALR
ncbi:TIGR02647 family protein [Reinekea marinisedimentorum]|uniref:Uncharacterized protein (TIGR02647 family) n=1 Tax=Reinekea marinisedimentorum TaxID=230495 RepID=A0A4R3I7X1_9GAMM|nr:TIGR02647 family protein [Reinekea marinisedimentorum]TCS41385.1 uncharacterized protein (TIGR02647 family) [Reinekea marinisedimentorum]